MVEEIRHNPANSCFEVYVDDELAGLAHYVLADRVATFDTTHVEPRFGGRGVAGRLITQAMDQVRAKGEWKVRPECPFVVAWFDKNPDYRDLIA